MASKRIRIQLTGRFDDQKNVRLDEFIRQLDAIIDTLKELDYRLSHKRKSSVYYRIVEMYTQSPPTLVLEPVAFDPALDYGDAVSEKFETDLRSFAKRTVPLGMDHELRQKYVRMLENINGNITKMKVGVGDESVTLTGKVAGYIRPEEKSDKEAVTTISGKLETLQLHTKREFRIYPLLGAPSILCVFSEEMRQTVKDNIDKWVAVTGVVRYKGGSQFPSEMIVKSLRPKRDPKDSPTLLGLRGRGKLPEGETSEDIIRRMREDEW